MRCLTQNIWNYSQPWRQRRDLLAALIRRENPDVVCLQETRHDWRYERGRGQGEQLAEMTGYHPVSAVGQVYMPIARIDEGVTILTKQPPIRTVLTRLTRDPHDRDDENERICLGVRLDLGTEVDVYNTHFSLSENMRISNARDTAAFIRRESGPRPAILMGDLNAYPDTPPVRYLRDEAGFVDCWTAAHPDNPGFTYSPWNPDHRIDYVLGLNLAGPVTGARVVGFESENGVYGSDHLGVVVDVTIDAGRDGSLEEP
jgi:endonuclease/exonuclease/phosphatase family metal-dependent hydrolase